jgi:carbamoyltransferase
MNSKVLAINGCHDASVTFVDKDGKIRIFEYERFCKKRFGIFKSSEDGKILGTDEKTRSDFIDYVKINLKEEPEVILYSELDSEDIKFLQSKFKEVKNIYHMGHHMSHCAGAYFQSGFKNALAISLDGGGFDYLTYDSMNVLSYSIGVFYDGEYKKLTDNNTENSIPFNPGIYGTFGYYVSEINKEVNEVGKSDKNALTYAGKIMGLAAYGNVREEWIEGIENYYNYHPTQYISNADQISNELSTSMGIDLYENCFSGQDSYDLAATNQYVFEKLSFNFILEYIEEYKLDVVFSGGCALNVLFNQRLKEYLSSRKINLYIPPYPSDCGLSFGHFTYYQSLKADPSPYCGIGIIDKSDLYKYYIKYNSLNKSFYAKVDLIVDLIKDGKIGGILKGNSEVGPRALGNRSIICDPSIADMKDILNSKVKFREWFRPFAPVCREEDKDKYFENAYPSEYMSFAPRVKEEYKNSLPSITHADGTARLQTVNCNQHSLFYDILTELHNRNEISVIMNTSFNIKGKPILTSIEDAFNVLETTELDFIVVENLLFVK